MRHHSSRDNQAKTNDLKDPLFAGQTWQALENFPVSGLRLPENFIRAIVLIKRTAADVNGELGLLDRPVVEAILSACDRLNARHYRTQFPVDVFQTGSATSTHMNVNEVIATLAGRKLGSKVHPNDQVNMGQSSNDVIPTAIHLMAALALKHELFPSMKHLVKTIENKAAECRGIVKTGRTHLMDAMPILMEQEMNGWAAQIRSDIQRLESSLPRLHRLALGGTAVGTGVNAHPAFSARVVAGLAEATGLPLEPNASFFESLSCQDTAVELSGQLKVLAVSLMKIANDLRWMNSGPLAGIGEIELKALQPGSSIMPGKVNPVVPEAVAMVAAQVIGNDSSITVAGQSGNFQLNVMLPLIAYNLHQSLLIASNASRLLADKCIADFAVNADRMKASLASNPILATALNSIIGYEKAAQVAKTAYRERRPILDVASELTDLTREELQKLLDPARLAGR